MECFKCNNLGHFPYECPQWNKEANYAELDEEEELLLMATTEKGVTRNNVWFLDSRCSNHICGDKGMFVEINTTKIFCISWEICCKFFTKICRKSVSCQFSYKF